MAAPRSMWSGTLAFGLVTVPVKMYPATAQRAVRFKEINSKTGNLVKQPRVDDKTGDKVPYEQIDKGYEIAPDRFVIVTAEELTDLAPERTKQIVVEEFVDEAQIDPRSYEKHYYLSAGTGGAKAYKLLSDAMLESGRVGIGRVVIRTRESLVAIKALPSGVLSVSTMAWADEIKPDADYLDLDGKAAESSERERKMAVKLINSLASRKFDPSRYEDGYRRSVLELVEAKGAGVELERSEAEAPAESTGDLLTALEASLDAVQPAAEDKKKPAKAKA